MHQPGQTFVRPALRDLVLQASRALARLDADRLEALAVSCQALNRDLDSPGSVERGSLTSEVRDAVGGIGALARVLDATRTNMLVMSRVRELQAELLEYGPSAGRGWRPMETKHGDN
jgi:hypothetical protein